MQSSIPMKIIATLHGAFPTKFGIPRQSGLVEDLEATVVFEPEYRNPDALRGLEGFSHLWLIWSFSQAIRPHWSPTVRPPRLGGNTRMGVFATRSPFRPNPIGLSSVRLKGIVQHPTLGPVFTWPGQISWMGPLFLTSSHTSPIPMPIPRPPAALPLTTRDIISQSAFQKTF